MLCWRNDIKTKRTHILCPLSCYLFRSPLIHIVEYVNIYAIQTLYRHKWFILPATLWQCQYLLYAYMKWNETFKIFALAFICLARKCKSVLQVSILLLYIFFLSNSNLLTIHDRWIHFMQSLCDTQRNGRKKKSWLALNM